MRSAPRVVEDLIRGGGRPMDVDAHTHEEDGHPELSTNSAARMMDVSTCTAKTCRLRTLVHGSAHGRPQSASQMGVTRSGERSTKPAIVDLVANDRRGGDRRSIVLILPPLFRYCVAVGISAIVRRRGSLLTAKDSGEEVASILWFRSSLVLVLALVGVAPNEDPSEIGGASFVKSLGSKSRVALWTPKSVSVRL